MTVQDSRHFLALLERVEKDQHVLAEAHTRQVERLDQLERTIDERFEKTDQRIMRLDVKVSALETRVGKLETRVGKLEIRVGKLEAKVDKLDAKLDALDAKIDAKFDVLAVGIERIASHLGMGSVISVKPTGRRSSTKPRKPS